MKSNIIQSLWIGTELPEMQRLCISSFLAQGHGYHLYTYQPLNGLPEGATLCDATRLLPEDSIFSYQTGFGKGSVSAFSNVFRYRLLLERGGWWVDTDVVCLKRFDFEDELVFATELDDSQSEAPAKLTASCVIKSPRGAEYLDYCLRVCEAKNKAELQWSEIGPYLLDEAVKRFDLLSHRLAVPVFNPVNVWDFRDPMRAGFDPSRLADSHAVHLWNEMWRSEQADPSSEAHSDSWYARQKERYLVR